MAKKGKAGNTTAMVSTMAVLVLVVGLIGCTPRGTAGIDYPISESGVTFQFQSAMITANATPLGDHTFSPATGDVAMIVHGLYTGDLNKYDEMGPYQNAELFYITDSQGSKWGWKALSADKSGSKLTFDIAFSLPATATGPYVLKSNIGKTWAVDITPLVKTDGTVSPTPVAGDTGKAAMQFATPPPMQIDVNKQYLATIKMAKGGQFVIQLYPDKAPLTVNSFVFLAEKGFFNGTTFHRVLEGFMAQGGDRSGTGNGGPGYQFNNESNDLKFDKPGVVAMANAGPNTNGSQFFITFGPVGLAESDYTIFGQVISGLDVVNSLTRRDPSQNPTFTGDVMESVTISEK